MSLIGLDVGTTGCKANLFDRMGRILGQGAREYAIAFPHPGWAEQDAEQVWQLAWSALSEAVREAGARSGLRSAARGQDLGLPARGTGALPVS
jgi:xylulokinase